MAVEEFPSARAQDWKDMLEVRHGARCGAKCRRIERASPRSEQEDAHETAADLEPTRVEVSVRNAVARDVEKRPEKKCGDPRAAGGARRSACRHMEGNYHGRLTSRMR
jgi:hypothetical protein